MTRRTQFFFFVCFNGKVTARNAIISSISHLMEEMEQSSIGGGQVSWRQKPSTCFVLRGERVASSSRFLARSKLQRTVEIRTIEMILKSTIMGNSTLRTNLLNQNYECMWLHVASCQLRISIVTDVVNLARNGTRNDESWTQFDLRSRTALFISY